MVVPLLLASLFAVTPAEPASPADPTVSFAHSMEGRHARLLEGLELAATFKPSETPALRITDAMRFGLMDAPLPLDTGGAQVQGETRQVLALLLGLLVGFGTGHLLVGDQGGFILFLIVDVAIIVVSSVFRFAFGGWFWGLGGLGLLISHVIQGIDALGKAGGPRVVEETRQKAVLVSDVTGGRDAPLITTRAFAFSF
jgi:hypothetical protein